jgi:hypothetical protein
MAIRNISEIARRAQYLAEDQPEQAQAIRAGLDPMLRDIEVESGMVRDANVLPNRMYGDTGAAGTMAAYYEALATRLPGYVNTRRAYEEELRKKKEAAEKKDEDTGGGGGDTMQMPQYGMPLTGLRPPQFYLPQAALVPDIKRDTMYVTSPYGAMPTGTISGKPTPAARALAQRKYSRTGTVAM